MLWNWLEPGNNYPTSPTAATAVCVNKTSNPSWYRCPIVPYRVQLPLFSNGTPHRPGHSRAGSEVEELKPGLVKRETNQAVKNCSGKV